MNSDFSIGTMKIPSSYCNGMSNLSDLQLTAEFIHEFMHGYISTILKDFYQGTGLPEDFYIQSPFNPSITVINHIYWTDIVQAYFPGTVISGNQHVLLFTHFKNKILEALHAINGGVGNPSDYEYYANLLINTADLAANSPYAFQLGLKDVNGNIIFNNNDNLLAWNNNVGGDNNFSINCN
ncbi:MAG: hypothetical protein WAT79_09720 [Saprospiraceae bacterium]